MKYMVICLAVQLLALTYQALAFWYTCNVVSLFCAGMSFAFAIQSVFFLFDAWRDERKFKTTMRELRLKWGVVE